MPSSAEVLEAIRQLELDLEQQFAAKQEEWKYRIELGRAQFEQAVLRQHKAMRTRVGRYLRESSIPNLLTAPVIYSLTLPFLLLDAWVTVYQWVCFPIYGIPRVRRADYIAIDRGRLAYLNGIEKANCNYCGYANGLVAYIREIVARTEQYWCPIKHARAVRGPHTRYRLFADYGDARGYHVELRALRDALQKEK